MLKMYKRRQQRSGPELRNGDIIDCGDYHVLIIHTVKNMPFEWSMSGICLDQMSVWKGVSRPTLDMETVIGHADSMADILCPELRAIVEGE